MKNTVLGLRTVAYKVADLQKAKAWYAEVFGVQPYFDEPFYVGFNIGGYELGLMPEEGAIKKGEGVLAYWGVEDIQTSFDKFIELGATVHEKPQNVGGDLMVSSVFDPWGNIIGLIYNPYFKLD